MLNQDYFNYIYDQKYKQNRLTTKPSTRQVKKALKLFNNPHLNYPCIHIVGTNGKTTNARIITYLLKKFFNLKVGLFTSPHINSWEERIKVDEKPIEEKLGKLLLAKIINTKLSLSFFETLTILAFLYFSKKDVDIAIIEAGLGGSFDSTNVLGANCLASIISTISYDHLNILGNTLFKIASDKASIIKPSTPLILQQQTDIVYEHIVNRASRLNSKLYYINNNNEQITNPSVGRYVNMLTAFETVNKTIAPYFSFNQIKLSKVQEALSEFHNCGRYESVSIVSNNTKLELILDVAHNSNSLYYLLKNLTIHITKKVVFCIAVRKDKDFNRYINLLLNNPLVYYLIVTTIDSMSYFSPEIFNNFQKDCDKLLLIRDKEDAIKASFEIASKKQLPIVVTGSFAIVSFLHSYLNLKENL